MNDRILPMTGVSAFADLVITIDASEAEEAARFFDQFDEFLAQDLNVAMEASLQFVEGQVAGRTPVGVTGNLQKSITHKIETPFPNMTGYVFSPLADYARVIEYGRTPGAKPPPVDAIQLWVTRKLQVPEESIEEVSRLIALAIGHRGFSPEWDVGPTGAKMFEEATEVSTPYVVQQFANAVDQAVRRFKV